MTWLIILFLIMGAVGVFLLFFMDYANTKPRLGSVLHLFLAIGLTVVGFIEFGIFIQKDGGSVKCSAYEIKTEVRQEVLNGQIVSTDTVYVFTPKKKAK